MGFTNQSSIFGLDSVIPAYGCIDIKDGVGSQTIGAAFVKIKQFNSTGPSRRIAISAATDDMIVEKSGIYKIAVSLSFAGSPATVFTTTVFVDGVQVPEIGAERAIGTGKDVGTTAFVGLLDLSFNQMVDIRVKADGSSRSFDIKQGNFTLTKVENA